MDPVRYYAALLPLMFAPGVLLYWFSIHPLIRFWRRVGPRLTLAIHYLFMVVVAWIFFGVRGPLLSVEFGTQPPQVAAGVLLMLGFVAWALFSNYLASYVLAVVAVVMLRVVISMEEKELRDRFGSAYDEYRASVPRLIPRFTRSR